MHALDVLGDPIRRRILELLAKGEHTSGEVVAVIQAEFRVTQPAVSQHLKVLRDNGFASVRPDGARRIYSLATGPLRDIDEWLATFRNLWAPKPPTSAAELSGGKRQRTAVLREAAAGQAELPLFPDLLAYPAKRP
jgi:DNA-binding transcriptional ArsR family regulator